MFWKTAPSILLFKNSFSLEIASFFLLLVASRAHTVVAILFKQKGKNEAGQETTKVSTINLVDLAGR